MLEKPDIPDQQIISRLRDEYALQVARVYFLPLGADVNTAVYRVIAQDGSDYFLKLRKGAFDETTVIVPQFLKTQAIQAIIAPLESRSGRLCASLGAYKMILYPFIQGKDAYAVQLSDHQWIDFGATLKGIHAARVPPELIRLLPREVYSAHWREEVSKFQAQIEQVVFDDPVAAKLAAFMKTRRVEIDHLVRRAGQLALALRDRSLEYVLCHTDIHAGNLLIAVNPPGAHAEKAHNDFYIVDWDNPLLAPKEHDLMFIGEGVGGGWDDPGIEALFYQGYGETQVDRMALAYYRLERIVQDIAAFCEQLLTTNEGGEDREQSYRYFTGQFTPGHEVDIAWSSDKSSHVDR